MSREPWDPLHLQQQMALEPRLQPSIRARLSAIENWDSFRIVLPTQVFDTTCLLMLDDLNLELEHVGGQHAKDSIVVRIPLMHAMFLGDCYYPPPLHHRSAGDQPDWNMLERLLHEDIDLYVEGHGEPQTREQLRRRIAEARSSHLPGSL